MPPPSPPLPAPRAAPIVPGAAEYLGAWAQVELWRLDLDRDDPEAPRLLDPAERARAGRFAFEHLRRRFTAGRAGVRRVLAAYLGRAPEALAFARGPHGKPSLAGGPPFSYSSAQGCGLLAVGRDREVGVDVERLREVPDAAGVAASAFTAEEVEAWRAAGGDARAAFLRVWTRKEAALKALGVGLGGDEALAAARAAGDVEVLDLPLDAEHVAALALWAPRVGRP